MASTDAKSGFRLPWSTDRNESDDQANRSADPTADQASAQVAQTGTVETTPVAGQQDATGHEAEPGATREPSSWDAPAVASTAPPRKPNKFMADLTKAMQTAAEAARADVLEKFSSEAKAHIEAIHASTADEATQLRKRADEDIAAIREWSKNEIARIREETDERIAHRKDVLEREIEAHAAQIEARIEHVQSRVTGFEAEMASFFERLLAEEDPTRFAAMAETLPEPPAFDHEASAGEPAPAQAAAAAQAAAVVETPPAIDTLAPLESEATPPGELVDAASAADQTPWESETPDATDLEAGEPAAQAPSGQFAVASHDEATAAEAAYEPTQPDAGDLFSMPTEPAIEPTPVTEAEPVADADPRLSALGIEQDFAAAEAEAASFPTDITTDEQEIPTIAEDALAARLAGLVADEGTAQDAASTRVVVTGLVSVASIAGFKRNLARVDGVRSVGVSSGPDGEFVFAVSHDPGLDLSGSITTLPGFGARVTNEAPGELTVAARDPESEG